MAGQVAVQLDVLHTFQQRFQVPDFTNMFSDAKHYIVSSRPKCVVRGAKMVGAQMIEFDVYSNGRSWTISMDTSSILGSHSTIPLQVSSRSGGTFFEIHSEGSTLLAGDVWTLVTAMGGPATAHQRVLYVGQTYGRDGDRPILERTGEHSTIQRIYSEHIPGDDDIFITPCVVQQTLTDYSYDPQGPPIDNDESKPSLQELLSVDGTNLTKKYVDVIEHALVQYFKPSYNSNLKNWKHSRPTKAAKSFKETGLTRLRVLLGLNPTIAEFGNRQRPYSPQHDISVSFQRGVSTVGAGDALFTQVLSNASGAPISAQFLRGELKFQQAVDARVPLL